MRLYQVTVPIAGYASIDVEAESAEAAINEALDSVGLEHIESWESLRVIVEGNVFHGPCNRASADLIEEIE